jgi:Na+/melibiose symporter-like transporter
MLGGIAMAVISLIAGQIMKTNYEMGFLFTGICMLVAFVIVFFGVHEPDTRKWTIEQTKTKNNEEGIVAKFKELIREPEKSPLWMVAAIFAWFIAYQAVNSLMSLYATKLLGLSRGSAQQLMFIVSVVFLLFAIPSSMIAQKITRRKTILIGLILCSIALFVGTIVQNASFVPVLYVVLVIFGLGWACININSIAMLWDMAATPKQVGTYTGIYYFGSFLAAVVGPMTLGFTMQYISGLELMFPVCGIFMVIAFFIMLKVKRGEPELTEEEKKAKEEAIKQGK